MVVGDVMERLTLLEYLSKRSNSSKKVGLFRCDCGTTKPIIIASVVSKNTRSCGCLDRELASSRAKTHGMSTTSIYKIWSGIKKRCLNKKYREFHLYGGRGIEICDRWKESFEDFYTDMGPRPSKNHSIDRIDNNSGYSKANCRWATSEIQDNNKRSNVYLTSYGVSMSTAQWSRVLEIPASRIRDRLYAGWSDHSALFHPRDHRPLRH